MDRRTRAYRPDCPCVLLVAAEPVSVRLSQSFGNALPGWADASQRESLRATCFFCLDLLVSLLAVVLPAARSEPVALVPLMLELLPVAPMLEVLPVPLAPEVLPVPLREDELLRSFDDVVPSADELPLEVPPIALPVLALVEPLAEPFVPLLDDPL
jgi:hypothetical protein